MRLGVTRIRELIYQESLNQNNERTVTYKWKDISSSEPFQSFLSPLPNAFGATGLPVRDVTAGSREFVSLNGWPRATTFYVNLETLTMVERHQWKPPAVPDIGPVVLSSDGFEMYFLSGTGTEKDLLRIFVFNMRTGLLLRNWEISFPKNWKVDANGVYVRGKTMVIHSCTFSQPQTEGFPNRKKTIFVCTGIV